MMNWIKKNRLTAISLALLPILALGGILGTFSEKFFVRPYVTAQADTVFVKKHNPCEKMVYEKIGLVSNEQKIDREFIIKMYYNQKATMTKAQEQKANDLMVSDTSFKRLIAGE